MDLFFNVLALGAAGGVAIGISLLVHWLLKKRWPKIKWWDSVAIIILLLAALGMVALMLGLNVPLPYPLGLPLPH